MGVRMLKILRGRTKPSPVQPRMGTRMLSSKSAETAGPSAKPTEAGEVKNGKSENEKPPTHKTGTNVEDLIRLFESQLCLETRK